MDDGTRYDFDLLNDGSLVIDATMSDGGTARALVHDAADVARLRDALNARAAE